MSETNRYTPRPLALDVLIDVLVKEHSVMKESLQRARHAASRNDFQGVRAELQTVEPVFRQHIADEESEVLGFLIRTIGVKEAADEIKIFQQHRPIYIMMMKVSELASKSSVELEASQAELEELFELHTKAEEERAFPRARLLNK